MTLDEFARRLTDRLTPPYNKEDTSNNYKFMKIPGEQKDDILEMLQDVLRNHWLEYATGIQLDQLGALVGAPRGDRNDADYRAYLETFVSAYVGGGTIDSIKQAILGLNKSPGPSDESEIVVIDGYLVAWHGGGSGPSHYAHFYVYFTVPFDTADIADYTTAIENAKGAGIKFDGLAFGIAEGIEIESTITFYHGTTQQYHRQEDIEIEESAGNFHYTDLTETDSENVVA